MSLFKIASAFLSYVSLKSISKNNRRTDKIIEQNTKMIDSIKSRSTEIPLLDPKKFPKFFKK